VVVVDYEGIDRNGAKIKGVSGKALNVKIGSGRMIPGFEDELIGLGKSDKKSFDIQFPKNYAKQLAGRNVTFNITVSRVAKEIDPEFNDEFACKIDPKYKNIEDMKKDIFKGLKKRKNKNNNDVYKEQLFQKIIDDNPFDIPESMLVAESNNMINAYIKDLVYKGVNIEENEKYKYENLRKKFDPASEKRVKSTFIVLHIADKENIKVSDDEVKELITSEAYYSGQDPEKAYNNAKENGSLKTIRVLKLEEKVADFLLSNMEYIDKKEAETDKNGEIETELKLNNEGKQDLK